MLKEAAKITAKRFASKGPDIEAYQAYLSEQPAYVGKHVLSHVHEEALLGAIEKSASDKALGADSKSIELLKQAPKEVQKLSVQSVLEATFGPEWQSLTEGNYRGLNARWPNEWHAILMAMLYKQGNNPALLNKRRPIGLTSRIALLVQTALLPALEELAEKYVEVHQYGGRKGNSCHLPALIIQALINQAHAKKQPLYILYVDFEDAYTTLEYECMWALLLAIGMHGSVVALLQHMHSLLLQILTWHGPSWYAKQGRGVIQGGIISVLLFLIYLEPLSKMIDAAITGVSLAGMAIKRLDWVDDKAIVCSSPREVRAVIRELEKWCRITKMKVVIKPGTLDKTVVTAAERDPDSNLRPTTERFFMWEGTVDEIEIPVSQPHQCFKHVGFRVSMDGAQDHHHTPLSKIISSIFGTLNQVNIADQDHATMANALVAGLANFNCLLKETVETSDAKEIIARQDERVRYGEAKNSPRLLFYLTRGRIHYYVAHHASLLVVMAKVWNLPREHPTFRAAVVDLVFTLNTASLLISPFHDNLPEMEWAKQYLHLIPGQDEIL